MAVPEVVLINGKIELAKRLVKDLEPYLVYQSEILITWEVPIENYVEWKSIDVIKILDTIYAKTTIGTLKDKTVITGYYGS